MLGGPKETGRENRMGQVSTFCALEREHSALSWRRAALLLPFTCAVLSGRWPVTGLDKHLLAIGLDHVDILADLLEGHLEEQKVSCGVLPRSAASSRPSRTHRFVQSRHGSRFVHGRPVAVAG